MNKAQVALTAALTIGVVWCPPSLAATSLADCNNPKKPCKITPALAPSTPFDLRVATAVANDCGAQIKLVYADGVSEPVDTDIAYSCNRSSTDKQAYQCKVDSKAPAGFADGSSLRAKCSNSSVAIELNDRKKPSPTVAAPAQSSTTKKDPELAAEPGPPFLPLSEWALVLQELRRPAGNAPLGHYYNQDQDVAVIFVDSDATPFFPLPDVIDEDDDIFIAVVDTPSRLDGAEISVQGCSRTPSQPRVYGSLKTLGVQTAGGKAVKPDQPAPLRTIIRAVGRCAGADTGGPQVTIRVGNRTSSLAIPVNPLYRFALGLAVGVDFTQKRSFDVRTAAGDTAARIVESREMVGVTSLVHISMYLSLRDFRKKHAFCQKWQVFAGLEPTNLSHSLTLGFGFELGQGVNLLAGWRVLIKQPVLAEGSGLQNGSFFDGTKEEIPTRDRWEVGLPFLAIGLSSDLLARIR